jgi:hypothetical protein
MEKIGWDRDVGSFFMSNRFFVMMRRTAAVTSKKSPEVDAEVDAEVEVAEIPCPVNSGRRRIASGHC